MYKMSLVTAGLILTLLAACGSTQPEATPALPNTAWLLVSLNGENLIPGTSISLEFSETFLQGTMTCNGYGGGPDSGKFTATEAGALAMGPAFAVTVQLCSTPEGIMEQEATYIDLLLSAATYRIAGERLEIDNAAGETVLVYVAD